MIKKATPHYMLEFYENFVIAEAIEGVVVDNAVVMENLSLVFDHFGEKKFTLISHRKNNYEIDLDVYALKLMKKIRAMAIVSPHPTEKERAMAEQLQFDQSFAFFHDLEEAKGWALSVSASEGAA